MTKRVDLQEEFEDHILQDGIYVVDEKTEVKVFEDGIGELQEDDARQVRAFITLYPTAVVASGYETFATILLSKRPAPFKGVRRGTDFNYGATCLLGDLPARHSLLIIAEND